MEKIKYIILFFFVTAISCEKDDLVNTFPAEIRFDITHQLLKGHRIDCIDIDREGNAYIGSGTTLYYFNGSDQKSYSVGYEITDIAVSEDKSVWIGTRDGGLGHFRNGTVTWYTKENSGFPRDLIRNVEIASDGNVWFTSCAYNLGGLGVYDGKKFEFLTPENSPLNQNLIEDIEAGDDGAVYIATTGTVGRSNIYRITDNSWECLGDEKGTFYWVFNFSVSPAGEIFIVEDFSLSSAWNNNKLYRFRDEKWQMIDSDNIPVIGFAAKVSTDKRGYCWLGNSFSGNPRLSVYDGKSWHFSDPDLLTDNYITTIATDNDNNIWIGTFDGLFILNQ